MTALVFPYLPGLAWPVTRSMGNFDTTTQVAMSGKKTSFANRTQATYHYELVISALDSDGSRASLIANSQQTLAGFFNQCLGGALIFNFWDVDDCLATAQSFGVGDGSTTAFQLARTLAGWTDNVFAPLVSGDATTVPSGTGGTTTAPYSAPQIFVAGELQSSEAYTVSSAGVVTFASAPGADAALTWTGNYYWPCTFDDDALQMAKFMGGLWEVKKIAFTTRIF